MTSWTLVTVGCIVSKKLIWIVADIAGVMSRSFEAFFCPYDAHDESIKLSDLLDGGSVSGLQAVAAHLLQARPKVANWGNDPEQVQRAWLVKAQGLLAYRRQHPYANVSKNKELSKVLAESDAVEQGLAKLSVPGAGQAC